MKELDEKINSFIRRYGYAPRAVYMGGDAMDKFYSEAYSRNYILLPDPQPINTYKCVQIRSSTLVTGNSIIFQNDHK